MADYLPRNDAAYNTWLGTFFSYLEPNFAKFGLVAQDVTDAKAPSDSFIASLAAHVIAQTSALSATEAKDINRAASEAVIRALVGRIQKAPGTTDIDRKELGITVRGAAPASAPLPTQDDTPHAIVDVSNRLKHIIRFENQTTSGTRKARPAGALGAEVWVKIGEAPTDPSQMTLVGVATRSPFVVEYTGEDAGKQANYMMRWVGRDRAKGSWSETESATIAA